MNKRITVARLALVAAIATMTWAHGTVSAAETPAKRPNFVWILSEDNSVHYHNMYFESGAPTPQIDALAKDGVIFNHAFSVAPVCSAARSVLATGCYGPRIGTQFHRAAYRGRLSQRIEPVFAVMGAAGYFTSNHGKTDYNFTWEGRGWSSKGNWKGRDPGQPFFYKVTYTHSHEGQLHKIPNNTPAPEDEFVQPRHPNTEVFRQTHHFYNETIKEIDGMVGHVADELEKDGVLEDTFIFYFADNGGVLPGSKGYCYETGLHVPLVVRIPANFKHLVDLERGARVDGFVEFTDFGATIMHLAGITPPAGIDGTPFMGPGISKADLEARDEAFGFADRMDEKYDMVRTLRKDNLKYMRSYTPFYYDGLRNSYRYRMKAYNEWRRLYEEGELNKVQAQFFEPREPEALYDVVNDPYETVNLAKDPAYATQLKQLRERLAERMREMPDLSLYPEGHLIDVALDDAVGFGQEHKAEIAELLAVADLSLLPFEEAKAGVAEALKSDNPWKRYWGLIVCSCFMNEAESFAETAKAIAANDKNQFVRFRAAEFLGLIEAQPPKPMFDDLENTLLYEVSWSQRRSKKAMVNRANSWLLTTSKRLLDKGNAGYNVLPRR